MKTFAKYLAGAFISLIASSFLAYLATLAHVQLYAHQMRSPLNTLSDDHYMAFENVLVALMTLLIGWIVGGWLTHRIVSDPPK